jgi:hypothetical protein
MCKLSRSELINSTHYKKQTLRSTSAQTLKFSLWFSRNNQQDEKFVIEFIIQNFIEGPTCFERHTAHHEEIRTVFAAPGLYTHVVTGRCPGSVGNQFPPSLDKGRPPHRCINQRLQIQFRAPDDERYATRNMLGLQ